MTDLEPCVALMSDGKSEAVLVSIWVKLSLVLIKIQLEFIGCLAKFDTANHKE